MFKCGYKCNHNHYGNKNLLLKLGIPGKIIGEVYLTENRQIISIWYKCFQSTEKDESFPAQSKKQA